MKKDTEVSGYFDLYILMGRHQALANLYKTIDNNYMERKEILSEIKKRMDFCQDTYKKQRKNVYGE
jgi:hypothetical protein